MNHVIVPITEEHIEGFRAAVDAVAREKKYLAFLEAPSLEATRAYVLNNIEHRYPQFIVESDDRVVGWCDVIPNLSRPVYRHSGILGVGLLAQFRGQGIGWML